MVVGDSVAYAYKLVGDAEKFFAKYCIQLVLQLCCCKSCCNYVLIFFLRRAGKESVRRAQTCPIRLPADPQMDLHAFQKNSWKGVIAKT